MMLLKLALLFAKIAVLTFGGGYAMVPLFESELVTRGGFLSAQQFADLVGLAQITPGPIGFNSATYVGLTQGGIPGAVAASLGVMIPSLILALIVAIFLRRAANFSPLKTLMRGVRPCVVGVIGAAVIFFARTALCWQGAVVFAVVLIFRIVLPKLNPVWALALSAMLGYLLYL